ncbi:MAG TPA: hypothetical protein VF746_07170 [Longimicrobium sp.]
MTAARSKLPACLAAALLLGCAPAAAGGQGERAVLERSCAPTDARAVDVLVYSAGGESPRLRISVWKGEDELSGARVVLPGEGGGEGSAAWCAGSGACRPVRSATVEFGTVARGSPVPLRIDAVLPDGGRYRARHLAEWGTQRPLCG